MKTVKIVTVRAQKATTSRSPNQPLSKHSSALPVVGAPGRSRGARTRESAAVRASPWTSCCCAPRYSAPVRTEDAQAATTRALWLAAYRPAQPKPHPPGPRWCCRRCTRLILAELPRRRRRTVSNPSSFSSSAVPASARPEPAWGVLPTHRRQMAVEGLKALDVTDAKVATLSSHGFHAHHLYSAPLTSETGSLEWMRGEGKARRRSSSGEGSAIAPCESFTCCSCGGQAASSAEVTASSSSSSSSGGSSEGSSRRQRQRDASGGERQAPPDDGAGGLILPRTVERVGVAAVFTSPTHQLTRDVSLAKGSGDADAAGSVGAAGLLVPPPSAAGASSAAPVRARRATASPQSRAGRAVAGAVGAGSAAGVPAGVAPQVVPQLAAHSAGCASSAAAGGCGLKQGDQASAHGSPAVGTPGGRRKQPLCP